MGSNDVINSVSSFQPPSSKCEEIEIKDQILLQNNKDSNVSSVRNYLTVCVSISVCVYKAYVFTVVCLSTAVCVSTVASVPTQYVHLQKKKIEAPRWLNSVFVVYRSQRLSLVKWASTEHLSL